MQEVESKKSRKTIYLLLIVIFIISDVIAANYIFGAFVKETPVRAFSLFMGLIFLQIIASPIQAGLSDLYGRKKSLLISLSTSLLSVILVLVYSSNLLPYLFILIIMNLTKGILGNTIPISWAAIGDTVKGARKNTYRFSFALAEAGYAVGYLLLIFIHQFSVSRYSFVGLILFLIGVVFLCVRHFVDIKDTECKSDLTDGSFARFSLHEFSLVARDLAKQRVRLIMVTFCLWEISLYSILVLYADFLDGKSSIVPISMMVGYLCGTSLVKFCDQFDDHYMVKIGYSISVISILPFFVFYPFLENTNYILAVCGFVHAIGNAILSPTLLSIISKEKGVHERGKIYGLAESADTLAFLVASIVIMVLKNSPLVVLYLVLISFTTIAVSWFPYRKYNDLTALRDNL